MAPVKYVQPTKARCAHQSVLLMLKLTESNILAVVALLQRAKRVSQVYVLALVKTDVNVHSYHQLCMEIYFYENTPVHENGCADTQADVHTEDANDFGKVVEDANEEVDADNGLESVRKGISADLRVIVDMNLYVVVDCIQVGEG